MIYQVPISVNPNVITGTFYLTVGRQSINITGMEPTAIKTYVFRVEAGKEYEARPNPRGKFKE